MLVAPTGATPAERVLLELAAEHVDSFMLIKTAEDQLGRRLLGSVDDPRTLMVVAKTLREVVAVSGMLGRRAHDLLAAAESLRLQRRLHAGASADDV